MVPYLLAYAFYFLALAVGNGLRHPRIGFLIGLLPLAGLALLRGLVGVDLPMYEHVASLIGEAGSPLYFFEPGFELLLLAMMDFFGDPVSAMVAVAGFTTAIFAFATWRLERGAVVVALAIVPYFFLDMTMNGYRYGLAFSIVLLAAPSLVRGRTQSYLWLVLAAGVIQVTAVALGGLLYLLLAMQWKRAAVLAVVALGGLLVGWEYIAAKLDANSDLTVATASAGLAPLALSLLLLVACLLPLPGLPRNRTRVFVLAVLVLGSYTITHFRYMGLRFQQLSLFLCATYLACRLARATGRIPGLLVFVLWCVALSGGAMRLRNFQNDAGQGESPFVPYSFYWER